jgi:hypothetical protein
MVHALTQIHRALRPGGVVADLRPDRFAGPRQPRPQLPRICWASDGRERLQGVLDKAPGNLRRHRAASRAVKQALRRRLFLLEGIETFSFRYRFQNLGVFERWLSTVWKESSLRPSLYRRLHALQQRSRTGHIVVIEPVRLNILRKR